MESMFQDCGSLTYLNLSNFVTNEVRDISSMFKWYVSLKSLDISNFVTDKVKIWAIYLDIVKI